MNPFESESVTTLPPSSVTFSAANWAGVSKIVYGLHKTKAMAEKRYYEGMNDIAELNRKNNRKIELVYLADFEKEVEVYYTNGITRTEKVDGVDHYYKKVEFFAWEKTDYVEKIRKEFGL